MRAYLKQNIIILLLLLLGLCCAVVLCAQRGVIERGQSRYCVMMTPEDAEKLSYLPECITLYTGESSINGAVLLFEDRYQFGNLPIDGMDLETTNWGTGDGGVPCVRVFKLYGGYAARYAILGYTGAEELENVLYRALTDRGIRVLWLTPFVDPSTGAEITDGTVYEQTLNALAQRVAAHGLVMEKGSFSMLPAHRPAPLLYFGAALAAFAALWLLACALLEKTRWRLLLLLLAAAGTHGLRLVFHSATAALALLASCVFPCLAILLAVSILKRCLQSDRRARCPAVFLCSLLPAVLVSLAGGLVVAALQSSTYYLLSISIFRGVKLSQGIPLLFGAFCVFRELYGREGIREILAGKKALLVLGLLALLAAGVYFLLRTGDRLLSASEYEQRLRNLLERSLIVRPRTKEFLIAWPCLAVTATLLALGRRRWAWPFAVLSSVGFSSVVNTFCHSRTALWLSLVRCALGLAGGVALGLLLCLLLWLLLRPRAGEKS